MADTGKKRLCVAVYTPMIGGLYYSELVTQIMQLCEIKGQKVKIVRTGGYGEYNSKLGLSDVDIVILLRNAVHINWVREVRESGKAVVSISYDYFPLDVPVINSDHAFGIKLAVEELRKSGGSKFAFVGNMSNFDIRKRYESFCEYTEDNGLAVPESNVFSVKEDLLGGGYEAAVEFLKRKSDADAIVFGTTMNAIGFCKYLSEVDSPLLEALRVVGFDAHSMVPVLQPNITAVDQNYNLMVYKAISIGEEILKGKEVGKKHSIEPKLILKESKVYNNADAYMATSSELNELYDPNYMKCVTYNMHEWCEIIGRSNLDDIMILRPLFTNDLEQVTFGRFVNAGTGKKFFKVLKAILPDRKFNFAPQDKESLYPEENFPKDSADLSFDEYDKALHLIINKDKQHWGMLSVFGFYRGGSGRSSYLTLVMYLEWILTYISSNGSGRRVAVDSKQANDSKSTSAKIIEGKIVWNINTNVFEWDEDALSILGFKTVLDKGVYANMELSDRLLDSEISILRESIEAAKTSEFSMSVNYRHKNREYVNCELLSLSPSGEGVLEFILRAT